MELIPTPFLDYPSFVDRADLHCCDLISKTSFSVESFLDLEIEFLESSTDIYIYIYIYIDDF